MLALTNSALDFLVFELFFQTLLFCLATAGFGVFGLLCFPVRGESEDDVLADGCGASLWPCWLVLGKAELLPFAALCDSRVDFFDVCYGFCFSGGFDLSALVIVAVGDGGFDAGLAVECGRGRGEFG